MEQRTLELVQKFLHPISIHASLVDQGEFGYFLEPENIAAYNNDLDIKSFLKSHNIDINDLPKNLHKDITEALDEIKDAKSESELRNACTKVSIICNKIGDMILDIRLEK